MIRENAKLHNEWRFAQWDHERWPNFSRKELAERSEGWAEGTSPILIDYEFLDKLQLLRDALRIPLPITSGYRSPEYNERVSSTGRTGPHTFGRAVDIPILGNEAFQVVSAAKQFGFTGIGVKQNGPVSSRFVHLDDLEGDLRPWIWSY